MGKETESATSTLTSKGQVTIPKAVRELLHLHSGDRVEFRVEEGEAVRLVPVSRPVGHLYGYLDAPAGDAATVAEMDRSVEEQLARRAEGHRES